MLQIRGRDKQNNLTYVGEWIKIPQIAKVISCVGGYSTDRATIVDKGKKEVMIWVIWFHVISAKYFISN